MSDTESDTSPTIEDDKVFNKYKMAADICTSILKHVVSKCIADANILDLCIEGDKMIEEEAKKIFKKEKEMKKGISLPTCINVNNIACFYSPLKSEANDSKLKDGDLVKVNLGVHIDGFPVVGGHSLVVGASNDNVIKDRRADVIIAAHHIAEACHRLIKPGNENLKVNEMANKIAQEFECKMMEGIQSHNMAQNVFHDEKSIIWSSLEDQKRTMEKCQFEKFEVWYVNVTVSTGEGKPKECDTRTTVHRKNNIVYQLKMKSSRQFFSEITTRFSSFPFTLRAIEDEKLAKVGVMECTKHELLEPMAVYQEREGKLVASFQYTLLQMPNGPMKVGSLPFESDFYKSEHKIEDPVIKDLLNNTSVNSKSKKKKKKGSAASKVDNNEVETKPKEI